MKKNYIHFIIALILISVVFGSVTQITSFVGKTNPFTKDLNDNTTIHLALPVYGLSLQLVIGYNISDAFLTTDYFDFLNNGLINQTIFVNKTDPTLADTLFENETMEWKVLNFRSSAPRGATLYFRNKINLQQSNFTIQYFVNDTSFSNSPAPFRFALCNTTSGTLVNECGNVTQMCAWNAPFICSHNDKIIVNNSNNGYFNQICSHIFDDATGALNNVHCKNSSKTVGYLGMGLGFGNDGGDQFIIEFRNITADWTVKNDTNLSFYLNDVLQDKVDLSNIPAQGQQNFFTYTPSTIETILQDGCVCTNCTLADNICNVPFRYHSPITGAMQINITEGNYDFGIDNCTTFKTPILNLSYFDELENTPLDVNFGYDLTFTGSFNQRLNGSSSSSYSDAFCVNNSVSDLNWNVTGQIILDRLQYATRVYSYTTGNFLTASNNNSVNVSLFLINLSASSTITYTVLTTSLQPIDGTLLIYQCNGDGSRTQVSSTPISNGRAADNVELVNTPYSYDVVVSGTLFQDFNSYGQCRIEPSDTRRILVEVDPVDFTPVTGLVNIPCNLTRTGNNTVQMEWGTNPGDTSTITGCLSASRFALGTYTEFWTNCTTTGSIERTIPQSGFNYLVDGKLYQSGLSILCGAGPIEFKQETDTATSFGLLGLFSVIVLVVSMMLIFSGKGPGMLLGVALGLFSAFSLNITAFGWGVVGGVFALFIIIAWIGRTSKK